MPPIGDPACNPGICPDWELNQQPFGSQACAQSTEPPQAGHIFSLKLSVTYCIFAMYDVHPYFCVHSAWDYYIYGM